MIEFNNTRLQSPHEKLVSGCEVLPTGISYMEALKSKETVGEEWNIIKMSLLEKNEDNNDD